MSTQPGKRKARKGEYGYTRAERKRRLLVTAVLFAVPLLIFFTAFLYFKTRLTVWTVVATVGCLPACKSMVNLIMLFRSPFMDENSYRQIAAHSGELLMSYEMYMTFYEKSAFIDAFAICGNLVVGYSSDPNIDIAFMETEAQKILKGNGFRTTVKIFKDLGPYLERLDSMNAHRESLEEGIRFRPDERYPELSRNELIRHTILAICL
ncbi:MAG TPA: hypothetical protein IAA26_08125 [Candidatus Blautia faecipullorum]|nr:hypothetical protein [Candidatus Blautia faecipullorum]